MIVVVVVIITQPAYSVESTFEPERHGSKASHLTIVAPITTLRSNGMAWRCFLGEETSLPGSLSTLAWGPFSRKSGEFFVPEKPVVKR